jgi:hypothetical protein
MASGCPHIDGAIVYQARAMYNSVYDVNKDFEDNCLNVENREVLNNVLPRTEFNGHLFPNPTTGELNLSIVSTIELEKVQVKVYDVLGKIVFETITVMNNGIAKFSLDINSGVYFIEILTPEKEKILYEKLIINK